MTEGDEKRAGQGPPASSARGNPGGVRALALVFVLACQGNSPAPEPAKPAGGVEVIEAPSDTIDVAALVRTTAAAVTAQHRRLFVYVGATWCEPCQQIHAAIEAHRLDAAFPDLTLLEFDLDRDGSYLTAAGYDSPLIPLFAIPAADGTSSPRRVYGGQHDADNVKLLTGKLHSIYE